MEKVAIVTKRTNGDVEYKILNDVDTDMRWLKRSILFLFAAVLCPLFLKYLGIVPVGVVAGLLAVIGVGIFLYMALRSHSLGKAEKDFVISIINDFVTQGDEVSKQKELKVKFYSDCLDSYGTIDEEYVLVLLDKETVLKYPIRQLKRKDERFNHKLIVSKCEVCDNNAQKERILRKSLISKVANTPLFASLMTWGVIVFILGFSVALMYLYVRYMHSVDDVILLFVSILGLLAFAPLYGLADKRLPHNRFCDGIRYVLSVPLWILSLTKLVMPSLTIMVTIVLMFAYSFLPVYGVIYLIEQAGYSITMEGKLFILLTIPLILATHCSDYIRGYILKMTLFRENDHHYHLFMRELIRFVYTK